MAGPMVRFGTKWPSMTSRCTTSACPSTVASSSARREKSAESSEGAMRRGICAREYATLLLHDPVLLRLRHDHRDAVPRRHGRAVQGELADDDAVGDAGIGLVLDRRDVQPLRQQRGPYLVEGMVDEVGHHVLG